MTGPPYPLWRHQMETFSALLALCVGNSPVTGEFPSQRLVTRSFGAFFDVRLNKRLNKQSWGWRFETPSCSLWRHCNVSGPWQAMYWLYVCRKWLCIVSFKLNAFEFKLAGNASERIATHKQFSILCPGSKPHRRECYTYVIVVGSPVKISKELTSTDVFLCDI